MSFPPSSPSSSSSSHHDSYPFRTNEKDIQQSRDMSKHPYRSEWRERQGSASEESTGPYDHYPPARPRKSFLKRLTSCFEFDDSDPVARYRPRHEAIFGKNPVYRNHQIQPQNEDQAKMIPSETQAPNSFAGGTTGGSGTGGSS
ncbi:hypothetical protein I302_106718 [Kwoniella bestiolae CBS 10118]|uniref:Uncharacterized protein n=1 Tax=Kwoniella bestiolae CBS 10118 TaxID=1296100 RepID=A0A1B9G0L3_9TREE|nr:hypothetical protein I302_06018 [Kwoniella bestiolae CBS 10118]OCF24557.1 hypothetical protein I302_06018 [Kwoniella bestiolae CBS 10118]